MPVKRKAMEHPDTGDYRCWLCYKHYSSCTSNGNTAAPSCHKLHEPLAKGMSPKSRNMFGTARKLAGSVTPDLVWSRQSCLQTVLSALVLQYRPNQAFQQHKTSMLTSIPQCVSDHELLVI